MGNTEVQRSGIGGLIVASGPDAGLLIALGDEPSVVGRESGCEVRLVDPAVSRRHLQLARGTDGRWTVEDLGSSNGTLVGGKRLERFERRVLGPGDEITLGETLLQVLSEDEADGSLRRRRERAGGRDPVAQVATRELFEMRLRTEVALAGRKGTTLSVALLELDRAASLEASEPGAVARILPELALKLIGLLRDNDLLARYDDVTLGVLLADDPSPTPAYVTAERMCTAAQTLAVQVAGRTNPVTASVGLATDKGRRDLTAGELLERAFDQVGLARDAGGNCVSRWVHVSARDRLPARSTDLAPTELDQARKTKILRGGSLAPGPRTIPPPPHPRKPDDPDDLL